MKNRRKIACITGTRADYGYLRPVMKKIEQERELELIPIATGMHFYKKFGHTFDEVKKDFPDSLKVPLNLQEDNGCGTSLYVADGIKKLAKLFRKIKPDMLLVLGDRTETFAGVQAAVYTNIPIAHMAGGDLSEGNMDNSIRHAITKFAHVHLAGTEKSAKRLICMGEEPWRIHVVGYSSLDEISNMSIPEKETLFEKYEINPKKPYILVVQHPETLLDPLNAPEQIKTTLESILATGIQTFLIYPNNDAGGRAMINVIKKYENKIKAKASVPREDYIGLMKYASLMVGNSSSGIIESSLFKIPVINLGHRQDGREGAGNVINVPNYNKKQIASAINYALSDKKYIEKLKKYAPPYGNEHTSERICGIIKKIKINENLIKKKFAY